MEVVNKLMTAGAKLDFAGSVLLEMVLGSPKRIAQKIVNNIRAQTIVWSKLGDLVFGQQRYSLRDFLLGHYGQAHTIMLPEMPHVSFLRGASGSDNSADIYDDYLRAGWRDLYGLENTAEKRIGKQRKFLRLYREIENDKQKGCRAIREPLLLCPRPDGKYIIIHGNHRAAIAFVLGLDVRAVIVKPTEYLEQVARNWGRDNVPKRAMAAGDKEMVRGGFADALGIADKVDRSDIAGKRVYEVECGIGGNGFWVVEWGAESFEGVDSDIRNVGKAMKLNAYFAGPCKFKMDDYSGQLARAERADTVFFFSAGDSPGRLKDIIKNKSRGVLYFTGGGGEMFEDYEGIIRNRRVRSIDFPGYLSGGLGNRNLTRPLLRCVFK